MKFKSFLSHFSAKSCNRFSFLLGIFDEKFTYIGKVKDVGVTSSDGYTRITGKRIRHRVFHCEPETSCCCLTETLCDLRPVRQARVKKHFRHFQVERFFYPRLLYSAKMTRVKRNRICCCISLNFLIEFTCREFCFIVKNKYSMMS